MWNRRRGHYSFGAIGGLHSPLIQSIDREKGLRCKSNYLSLGKEKKGMPLHCPLSELCCLLKSNGVVFITEHNQYVINGCQKSYRYLIS
mmetsp:Transcript_36403/g.34417  ORF Transcript_36403/g.34417 Transcript_36403/m.34417 type:complete len:89 (-) Transcript_36403:392-658(-)